MGRYYNSPDDYRPPKSRFPMVVAWLATAVLTGVIVVTVTSPKAPPAPQEMSVQQAIQMVEGGNVSVPVEQNKAPVVTEPKEEPGTEPVTEPAPQPVTEAEEPSVTVYSGSGDDVVKISTPANRVWMLEVEGNAAGRHFAVKGYDANMESTELFVNTTDPYTGFVLDPTQSTALLEVSAEGAWNITVHDLYKTAPEIKKGQTVSGFGDAVYQISSYGMTAEITGNSDAHHFAVKSYGDTANELLVNTTDPYEGTVMLKGKPFLLVITSESNWTIQF